MSISFEMSGGVRKSLSPRPPRALRALGLLVRNELRNTFALFAHFARDILSGSQAAGSRAVAALAALLTVAACGGGAEQVCVPPDDPYLSARNHEPLRVPSGVNSPNRSEGLAIPDVPDKPNVTGRASCLDEPPSYFRSSGTVARSPEEVVASWAQAWANREADAVIALYSANFEAPTDAAGAGAWLEQRREQVATGPVPDAVVQGLAVEPDGEDRRVAKFVQKFGANSLRKELTLVRESGSWRIVEESVAAVR